MIDRARSGSRPSPELAKRMLLRALDAGGGAGGVGDRRRDLRPGQRPASRAGRARRVLRAGRALEKRVHLAPAAVGAKARCARGASSRSPPWDHWCWTTMSRRRRRERATDLPVGRAGFGRCLLSAASPSTGHCPGTGSRVVEPPRRVRRPWGAPRSVVLGLPLPPQPHAACHRSFWGRGSGRLSRGGCPPPPRAPCAAGLPRRPSQSSSLTRRSLRPEQSLRRFTAP